MKKQTKALLYNFFWFAIIYFPSYYLVATFSGLKGYWIPISVGIFSMILAPKFQMIHTKDGEKIYMKWLFFKGVKEVN
jgi:hypothetical protein